jgi:isopenicillin N synthase-like dioxygenase
MNKIKFAKIVRDAGLVSQNGALTCVDVEHIYIKVLPSAQFGLNLMQFMTGLRHVSTFHRISLNEVMERIAIVGAPQC